MAFLRWINQFLGREQEPESEGSQECRGDGGTSYYRPNMNKRTVMGKMADEKLTGQYTLSRLKSLNVKQDTGNFRPVTGATQNTGTFQTMHTGYTGNVQPIGNGYTGSMGRVPPVGYQGNMQDSSTGNAQAMHSGYTGRVQGMHSGFTGMGNTFDNYAGNGMGGTYGYDPNGMNQADGAGGGYAGANMTGSFMNGYAAPAYTNTNGGWNGVPPDNVTSMPQDRMAVPDTHLERVMVLTSMRSCYAAIGHMKDGETLILSLDSIADWKEAERWKYLLQGAAFTLRYTMVGLPGSAYMMLLAPSSVTILRDDDRGERELREDAAPQAGMNPQDQGWQNGTVPQPRRTRRANAANANWNNYDSNASSQNSVYGRQPASPEGYGNLGGYGYNT